ncbi:MAG TPA: signal peptidase II [Alphaproteobacteria bacterium]
MSGQKILGPLVVFALLVLDQISKWWVLEFLFRPAAGLGDPHTFMQWLSSAPDRLPEVSLSLAPIFNLTMVWNFGISFGLMQGLGLILLLAILGIIVGFSIWMIRSRAVPEICALGLIVGGALGNVADRLRFGAVADFLDFHVGGAHFPAFNVADAAISIGVVLLLLHGLFFAKKSA